MSKRRKKSNNIILSLIIFIILCVSGYFGTDYFLENSNSDNIAKEVSTNEVKITTSSIIENVDEVDLNNDKLNIIFFYVGQADCTLIKLNDVPSLEFCSVGQKSPSIPIPPLPL